MTGDDGGCGGPLGGGERGPWVCGKAQLHLTANTHSMTLQQLVDKVGGWVGEGGDGQGGGAWEGW